MTYDLLTTIIYNLFSPYMLGLALIGVVLGLVFGALPGVSSTMALAVMLPFTYGMETAPAMVLMLAVFFSSVYAGSVSAILLNIPGTPGAMITLLDGNAMAREGKAAEAMAYALIASILGGIIGWIFLVILAPTIATYALQFGSPEYAAVVLFGLALVAYASSGDMLRGLAAGAMGLIIGLVGRDQVTDVPRFTFGTADLQGGIDIIPLAIGLFGIAEVLSLLIRSKTDTPEVAVSRARTWPKFSELLGELPTVLRSSTIGTFVGAIPAAGSAVAVALAYACEKRLSKTPEKFGTGIPRGVVAPEAANNACVGGALIPMLTLGIPGDSITAVLIGVLLLHGLRPGPGLFENQPDLVVTIYGALFVAILLTAFVAGLIGIPVYRKILAIPQRLLTAAVLVLCLLGAYAVRNAVVDVWVAIFFGAVGFAFIRLSIPVLPLAFGAVLGPLLEENLRRTLIIHRDVSVFFERPISLVLVCLSLAILLLPLCIMGLTSLRKRRIHR
ncbi:tripartite tricarboxylate transporter permease [Pacificibacter marinus]|uniref:tripartite tricarboxylate transporter permease n=1 Tax=Pacificibacter marinus TaxID=658057 RepID=UPI001C076670|nr:tripartite tricarboxylate transporter permease [Pacificibacter marinus]MBU2866028.1 tripartite tricarboxylate transporter permease [Pacificibacter marinus]